MKTRAKILSLFFVIRGYNLTDEEVRLPKTEKNMEMVNMVKKPKSKATKYTVARVGWENENPFKSIVLLSMKERKELDVGVQEVVKVKKGRKSSLALVHIQFKDLLGHDKVCSVNEILAKELKLAPNDKVEVTKEVTETEYSEFMSRRA